MRAGTRGIKDQVLDLFASGRGNDAANAPRASLAPPQPPLAKRLNRNALTVAAVLMGMTVIASLVVMKTDGREAGAAPVVVEQAMAEAPAPSFLDEPVRTQSPQLGAMPDTSPTLWPGPQSGTQSAQMAQLNDAQLSYSPEYMPAAMGASVPTGPTPAQPRAEAFNAALRRSAVATTDGGSGASAGAEGIVAAPGSSSLAAEETRLIASADSIMRSAAQGAFGGGAPASGASSFNPRRAFLERAGDLGGKSVIARLEPATSPYVLQAGTVIPAVLLTSITSDLPGDCLGQVSRDVYDSRTQRILLIPKGSKLICRYDDQVVAGQNRLLIAWTRLLLPDGRSMTLPGLALKDPQGQTGAKGNVDNHTGRVFGRALLLSAIGAGAQLSQPRQASILAPPTAGQVAAGAVGQEMSQVALEVLRRGMDQPPTITVPQGQTFNVFLNGDLVFDGPYAPSP